MEIDYDDISRQLKVRPEILTKLIVSFSDSLTKKLQDLEQAITDHNVAEVRAILHEVKGTAGNLRLYVLSKTADVLREAVKSGQKKQEVDGYIKDFKNAVAELQDYMSQRSS